MRLRTLSAIAGIAVLLASPCPAVDKSGVGPNAISVPGGPGTIEGLGESYQPDLNSGTPKYGFGIDIPPGPAGHVPQLGCAYDGGGPNGSMGFGWQLAVPFVQRQTDEGIPRYVDAANGVDDDGDQVFDEADELDVFINDSSEELVPMTGGDFFCKNEAAFIRYRKVGDGWEGTQPDGTVMRFGATAAARIEDGTGRVFRWLLEEEEDTHSNIVRYVYATFAGTENLNQKYLSRIEYGPGAPPWTHFHFIAFNYEVRSDWFEDCRSGFPVRTGRRLSQIDVGTQGAAPAGHVAGDFNGDSTADVLNSRYTIDYLDYDGTNTHWSYVGRVQEIGADGVSTLPSTTFEYAVCNPPDLVNAAGEVIGGINEPFPVMDQPSVDLLDINADGLPDLLYTPGFGTPHQAVINRGEVFTNGSFQLNWDSATTMTSADGLAYNIDLQSISGILSALADMDGDGTADFCYYQAGFDTVSYFRNLDTNLGWGVDRPMATQDSTPPSPLGVPNVGMGDFDFDKRSDIIQTLDAFTYNVWFNLGNQTYSKRFTVNQTFGFLLSAPGVEIADFNGDRVPDLTRINSSSVDVMAGYGHGVFADTVAVTIPNGFLTQPQLDLARMRDINGDGLVDLVVERTQPGQIDYWLNLGNYTFSNLKQIIGLPAGVSVNSVTRWADMNGNGTVDLLYAESNGTPRMQTVDIGRLIGCRANMNMLTAIHNGIGLTTRYKYASSIDFVIADRAAGAPWPDIMPFPMNVVEEITEDDSLGNLYTNLYVYHNGFYEQEEKEFRGFGHVEEIGVGDTHQPTLVSRTFFDQGKQYEAMQGKELREQVETESGDRFQETITVWADPPKLLYTGSNGVEVVFAHPVARTNIITEKNVGTARTLVVEMAFDAFGNELTNINWGIVEGTNNAAFDDERFIITEYAIDTNRWIVDRPSRMVIEDETGARVAKTEYFYDDPTFSGSNFGTVIRGDVTLVRQWHDVSSPTGYLQSARTEYDTYGNPITQLDPLSPDVPDPNLGHYRAFVVDPDFHTYTVSESIHVGNGRPALTMTADYDDGFGVVVQAVDFSGHAYDFTYDPFARITSRTRPLDTNTFPSTRYTYHEAVPHGTGLVNYVEVSTLDRTGGSAGPVSEDHYYLSRIYTDGLGRLLQTKSEAGTDAGSGSPLVSVGDTTLFNARKQPFRFISSFYSIQADPWAFEDVTDPGWQGRFHENGSLVMLSLSNAHAITSVSDAQGRLVRNIHEDGTFAEVRHEPLLTRHFDANDTDAGSPHFNSPVVNIRDGLGRMIRREKHVLLNDDGTVSGSVQVWPTVLEYDLNDQLIRSVDPQNNERTFVIDGLTRVLERRTPDQGIWMYDYDDASNLVRKEDNKGQVTTLGYDGGNRLLFEDFQDTGLPFGGVRPYIPGQPLNPPLDEIHRLFDGTVQGAVNFPDVLCRYDTPQVNLDLGDGTTATTENLAGKRSLIVDLTGAESCSYDDRGRLTFKVKRIADPATGDLVSYTTRFGYDILDRALSVGCPDNDVIRYEYNDRNEVRRIFGDLSGDIMGETEFAPDGSLVSCRYGNDIEEISEFDRRGRPTHRIARPVATPGQPHFHHQYDYDAESNIRAIDDMRPQVPTTDDRHDSRQFTYDSMYRLTRYQLTDPGHTTVRGILDFRYDRIGNMLYSSSPTNGAPGHLVHQDNGLSVVNIGSKSFGGGLGTSGRTARMPGQAPGPGALTSTEDGRILTYDDNGNIITHNGDVLFWDFRDRLVAVSNATRMALYTYDHADARTTRQVIPLDDPTADEITIYVNRAFEIRPGQQPTKFVHYGGRRIARVISTYASVSNRLQRFQVAAGWNMLSMAVESATAADQLGIGTNPSVEACYKVNPGTNGYAIVNAGDPLPAGSVFWLRSSTGQVIEVSGIYTEPTNRVVAANGDFVPASGLEAVSLDQALAGPVNAWYFDSNVQAWRASVAEGPASPDHPDLPELLPPGRALYVDSDQATTLTANPPELRVAFYHTDHIGSLSAVTDANGDLIEESAFYPYGYIRNRHLHAGTREDYVFTGKEQDVETGLHYFGARYYDSVLATWTSVDPLMDRFPDASPYNYVTGNPIRLVDPDGRKGRVAKALDKLAKALGKALGRYGTNKRREQELAAASQKWHSGKKAMGSKRQSRRQLVGSHRTSSPKKQLGGQRGALKRTVSAPAGLAGRVSTIAKSHRASGQYASPPRPRGQGGNYNSPPKSSYARLPPPAGGAYMTAPAPAKPPSGSAGNIYGKLPLMPPPLYSNFGLYGKLPLKQAGASQGYVVIPANSVGLSKSGTASGGYVPIPNPYGTLELKPQSNQGTVAHAHGQASLATKSNGSTAPDAAYGDTSLVLQRQ